MRLVLSILTFLFLSFPAQSQTTGSFNVLNLIPGSSPLSPSNGDCWTIAGAGLNCKLAGNIVHAAPPLDPSYNALAYNIVCDGISDISSAMGSLVGNVQSGGGGTILLSAPGKTCRANTSTTIIGGANVGYIVSNGTKLQYDNAPVSLALIRSDVINLQPVMSWTKYSKSSSNDYAGFFYLFDDNNPSDPNNRQKAALFSLCSTSDNSPGTSYFHDCVGAELDSDNPFGATATRQWGLTANVGQKVSGGDGLMIAGEFDVTLVNGSVQQNFVDQSNSKVATANVCISSSVNCTAGIYFNLGGPSVGRFYDGIVFKPAVFAHTAFCLLADGSVSSGCKASLDPSGVYKGTAFMAAADGSPAITGCTSTAKAGGTSGAFSASGSCAIGSSYTLTFPATVAQNTNGWVCVGQDMTNTAVTVRQTSYTANSCRLTIVGSATGASDIVTYTATAF